LRRSRVSKIMTDAFEVTGAFAPAEILSSTPIATDVVETSAADVSTDIDAPAAPEVPNGFVVMGLAPELIHAVKDLGYTQPTSVQLKTIPLALPSESDGQKAGKYIDLMVSSQTGSGKTAAFLLPVLHTLLKQQAQAEADERAAFEAEVAEAVAKGEAPPKRSKRKDPTNPRNFKAPAPGALIVCPTRELAQQVANDAIDLVQHCRGLRIANIVGGMPYQLQIAKLQNANLVVATPGRLLDLQRSMQIKLDQVQFLVVDEADRMLDLGFSDDLAEINQLTIARKQTMMFSATFAPRIQQLAARVMREPQRVTIDNPQEKHVNIKQVLFWADNAHHKRKLLDHWLRDTINQAIVFASTQIECDGLANDLQQEGFDAVALHGALSQGLRNRRLMALRQGQVQILVATDVAARGIDVPTITHVFNFGLPMKAEDYTHRIGRTGRAGRDGLAVTFAEVRDRRKIFDIEAYTRQHFKSETIPGLEPQQRFPESRPGTGASFGGRGNHVPDRAPRDRNFGGGAGGGRPSFGGNRGGNPGFGDRNAAGPRDAGPGSYQNNSGFGGDRDNGPRDGGDNGGFNYARKGGFNDRFAGRPDAAPRGGDFAARKPPFSKPMGVKPGNAGKVFVPRDAKKRVARTFD
jgi:superfamily II DNA/RNA helicase